MTDAVAELIAALRHLAATLTACRGWGDQPHGGWTRIDVARERVRRAEEAVEAEAVLAASERAP
ncbi:MAG TPA: hypothetical protein VD931_09585 [Baekduia sp.]|nr:hypothetical protein [Baekduia sp.]